MQKEAHVHLLDWSKGFFSLNISLFRRINGGHFLRKWHEGSINTAELTVRMIAKISKVKIICQFVQLF